MSLSPATEPLLPSIYIYIYHDVLYGVKAPHPLFVKRPPKSALQKMKRLSLSVTRWVQHRNPRRLGLDSEQHGHFSPKEIAISS